MKSKSRTTMILFVLGITSYFLYSSDTLESATLIHYFDFEDGDAGFTSQGETLLWQYGEPQSYPYSAHSGTMVWGTNLHGNYYNNSEEFLLSPSFDLSTIEYPVLLFYHYYRTQEGIDGGTLLIKDGVEPPSIITPFGGYPSTSIYSEAFSGESGTYIPAYFVLPAGYEDCRIIFSFISNASITSAGWFIDDLSLWDGDIIPPLIIHEDPLTDTDDDGPYVVEAYIYEDSGELFPYLYWTKNGEFSVVEMTLSFEDLYYAVIPGQDYGTTISYYIQVEDSDLNISTSPSDAPLSTYSFDVRLAPPRNLEVENSNTVSNHASLKWEEPIATHPVRGYRIYWAVDDEVTPDEELLAGETDPWIHTFDAPAEPYPSLNHYGVTAFYDEGESEIVETLAEIFVPHIVSVEPDIGYQGESLTIDITGMWTRFVDGESEVDFGEGVEVKTIDVIDVNFIRAGLHIAEDARVGNRDILVSTLEEEAVGAGLFEVGYSRTPPALLDIVPDAAMQGESLNVTIYAINSEFLSCDPEFLFGSGVTVVKNEAITDTIIEVFLSIDRKAPEGERGVICECAGYTLEGVEFSVLSRDNPAGGGCGCTMGR